MKQDQLVWSKLVALTGFRVDNSISADDKTLRKWLSRILQASDLRDLLHELTEEWLSQQFTDEKMEERLKERINDLLEEKRDNGHVTKAIHIVARAIEIVEAEEQAEESETME